MRRPMLSSRRTIGDANSAQERKRKKKRRPAPFGMTWLVYGSVEIRKNGAIVQSPPDDPINQTSFRAPAEPG